MEDQKIYVVTEGTMEGIISYNFGSNESDIKKIITKHFEERGQTVVEDSFSFDWENKDVYFQLSDKNGKITSEEIYLIEFTKI